MNTDRGAPAFKGALYEQLARIGRAVANPHRLALIELLAQGERRVDSLARETGLSVANASQHLQALRRARLVEGRRQGTEVHYRLADPGVLRLWQAIRALGEARLAEVDEIRRAFLADRERWEAIDAETLAQRMAEDAVLVIDVRPDEEYRSGHLPGARSVPVAEIRARLHELPADRPVVAYCRGPYCVMADEALALLAARGYRAIQYPGGFPDWQAAGRPVARGALEPATAEGRP